jgi:peptide/nickel transport system substrate-binding protein
VSNVKKLQRISTYLFILGIMSVSAIFISPTRAASGATTITVGTTDKIYSLDPAKADDYFSVNILQNIGDGLLRYVPGSTNLELAMATGYTVSPSGLNYTVAIRSGLKFANGHPITATTFQTSIIRARDLNGDPAYLLQGLVDNVKVINTTAFQVNLLYPFSVFPSLMAAWVTYPVDPATQNTTFNDNYAGSGPYTIQAYVPGVELDLMANPNYFGTPANIPNVHIKLLSNSASLTTAIESGSIDVAYRTFNPSDSASLSSLPAFTHWTGPGAVIRYLVLNNNIPPFNDTNVRQALAYAVNRTQIASQVFLGTVQNLYSMVPIGMWSHIDAWKTQYGADQNIAQANASLQASGWTQAHPLTITLWYTPSHYGSTEANVATLIAEQLQATHRVIVKLQTEEWASYIPDFLSLTKFQVFLLGWYPDYVDPDDYLYTFGTTAGTNSIGTNYQNATMNQTAINARIATSQSVRTTLYQQMQTQMAKDNPEIPLWQGISEAFTKNTIGGVILDASTIFRYYTLTGSAVITVPPIFILLLAPLLFSTIFVTRRKARRA